MKFDAVYYEPGILSYSLGEKLKEDFGDIPWIPIESHNSIKEMQEKPNSEFGHMKRNLIIGIRKTTRFPITWFPIRLPAVRPCAYTAIWSAITTSAHICGFL